MDSCLREFEKWIGLDTCFGVKHSSCDRCEAKIEYLCVDVCESVFMCLKRSFFCSLSFVRDENGKDSFFARASQNIVSYSFYLLFFPLLSNTVENEKLRNDIWRTYFRYFECRRIDIRMAKINELASNNLCT